MLITHCPIKFEGGMVIEICQNDHLFRTGFSCQAFSMHKQEPPNAAPAGSLDDEKFGEFGVCLLIKDGS